MYIFILELVLCCYLWKLWQLKEQILKKNNINFELFWKLQREQKIVFMLVIMYTFKIIIADCMTKGQLKRTFIACIFSI